MVKINNIDLDETNNAITYKYEVYINIDHIITIEPYNNKYAHINMLCGGILTDEPIENVVKKIKQSRRLRGDKI